MDWCCLAYEGLSVAIIDDYGKNQVTIYSATVPAVEFLSPNLVSCRLSNKHLVDLFMA
jgi:hypothetical protein